MNIPCKSIVLKNGFNVQLRSPKPSEAGFHRVELTVRTFNDSGIALYEKAGFKRVGLLKDVAFIDNAYVDEYLYQLIL